MTGRTLLLPVETLSREFDARLMLALEAAGRGWTVAIGKRSVLHDRLGRFPPSVYFSKGFRSGNRAMFRIVRGLGHRIAGLDEEALVSPSDDLWLMKMDTQVLGALALAFAWGPHDGALYARAPGFGDTALVVSGNPRIDLLRPELRPLHEAEVASIRDRHGRFALLNTNFAMVNNFVPGATRFRVARAAPKVEADAAKARLLAHKRRLMEAFLRLVPGLAAVLAPDRLVIRPHPSEDARAWEDAARGIANASVIREGSVAPWLLAARVLVHNGCTSAVEAAVLGTPSLAYRPARAPGADNELPNALSEEHEGAELLSARAAAIVADRDAAQPLDPGQRAHLAHHLAALDGPFASTRVLDGLERHLAAPPQADRIARLAPLARLAARRAVRAVAKRSPRARGNLTYLSHKFPPLTVAEVEARAALLRQARPDLPAVGVTELAPSLFRIARP